MGGRLHICVVSKFKAGDLPPSGYLEWHEWAKVQQRAGIRQSLCICGKWITPQEQPNHETCIKPLL
jgi:hypothetical protein